MILETPLTVDEINLSDVNFWTRPDRDACFAKLRRERPVAWFEEFDVPGFEAMKGPGYWAFTRYADVMQVSRHPDVFISGKGVNIIDTPPEWNEFFGSMISMDAPRHTKLRLLVNKAFMPKTVARIEADVRLKARAIVDRIAPLGRCDFVTEVAALLPLQVICEMMGIPESEWHAVFEKTNIILGAGDPEYGTDPQIIITAAVELSQLAQDLGRRRLEAPSDDLVSALMHAEVDGQRLTTEELGSFFILLVVAGNETTRNAISHGMKALTDFPAARAALMRDVDRVIPSAAEEIVRWASPVIHFRRTAVVDTEVGGQAIRAGDKVTMWYNSANRDESVFRDPYTFDVLRQPNEHVGFGAGGPHFCLGANLARREIQVMFRELLQRVPDIHVSGDPQMLLSGFIHGIKRMPAEWTPVG
jgi:methyl-branched lipid omega-hydroxylase